MIISRFLPIPHAPPQKNSLVHPPHMKHGILRGLALGRSGKGGWFQLPDPSLHPARPRTSGSHQSLENILSTLLFAHPSRPTKKNYHIQPSHPPQHFKPLSQPIFVHFSPVLTSPLLPASQQRACSASRRKDPLSSSRRRSKSPATACSSTCRSWRSSWGNRSEKGSGNLGLKFGYLKFVFLRINEALDVFLGLEDGARVRKWCQLVP